MPENNKDTIYSEEPSIYNKKTVFAPPPEKQIGIDTKDNVLQDIIDGIESSTIDISTINDFSRVSQGRDSIFALIDTMCEDPIISSVLATYAEDTTETNDNGRVVWAESSDSNAATYVNYLLDAMNVDKHIYKWAVCLYKYGDVYLKLFRESEYKDSRTSKEKLNEDINIKAYSSNDNYTNYVEMYSNPAAIFELTQLGKSACYIIAPVATPNTQATSKDLYKSNLLQYDFRVQDIDIYSATTFVHGCLADDSNRYPEYVTILDDKANTDKDKYVGEYTVRNGQSIFYNTFKIWRELNLLQNSVLLNRVTKSSIVRILGVEVGDMPKEEVAPLLQRVKQLIEQKAAIDVGNSMNEYTNPGPIENNVYIATRNGQGNITTTQVGGDFNVGQLTDLEYFRDLLFSNLRVPKQFFGFTEDGAGFNGGTSLSIISSRYAKMIKRGQASLCQMITDAINLFLIDRGMINYVNKFTIRMLPPTTQDEIDRRENSANKIRLVSDIMQLVDGINDEQAKFEILKSLLAEAIPNTEVTQILQEYINSFNSNQDEESSAGDDTALGIQDTDTEFDVSGLSTTEQPSEFTAGEEVETQTIEQPEDNLPSPDELGLDFTNSNNPEFQ